MQVSAKKALQKKSVGQNTEKNKAKYNKVIHIFVRLKNKETLFLMHFIFYPFIQGTSA